MWGGYSESLRNILLMYQKSSLGCFEIRVPSWSLWSAIRIICKFSNCLFTGCSAHKKMTHITSQPSLLSWWHKTLKRHWTSVSMSTAVVEFVENHIMAESAFYTECLDLNWHPVFISDASLILYEIFDSTLRFHTHWALSDSVSVSDAEMGM